jgi:hypothetical protein
MSTDAACDTPALLTVLPSGQRHNPISARIIAVAGRRMTIVCDIDVPAETPITLESSEYLYLATVRSPRDADGMLILKIGHVLRLGDLQLIREKWTSSK